MKILKNKGFTLAEMLIVMAVVVVLAAAAIPAMSDQLETARETNDVDVARSAYTQAYTQAYLHWANTGALTTTDYTIKDLKFTQTTSGWNGTAPKIADCALPDITKDTTSLAFKFEVKDNAIAVASNGITVPSASSGSTT